MTINDLKNHSVGVLGFGQEGQALCTYLLKHRVTPIVYDKKSLEQWSDSDLARLHSLNLKAITGPSYIEEVLQDRSVIFRSPGIKIPDEVLTKFEQKQILITSQTQWFFEHSPAKIIGVTGTKGKGTTSSLLYEILLNEAKSRKIFLTGNIGKIQPVDFLDELTVDDMVIYELSSFQLQDLKQSPHIGICLMVTSDHLDYHSDLSEYHSAKLAIAAFQTDADMSVYNNDYPASVKIGLQGQGQKWIISKSDTVSQGANIDEENQQITIVGASPEVITIDTSDRLLRGNHNLENIAAASLAASLLRVPPEVINSTIKTFAGLMHRLQFVVEVNGVKYYNDSISTIPETTIAAIDSFPDEAITLIVGGSEKNLDYTKLAEVIISKKNINRIFTMGPVGEKIGKLLSTQNFSGKIDGPFTNFENLMKLVKDLNQKEGIVLLSPGAPSFDMFTSYTNRGDEFVRLANPNVKI